MLLHGNDHQFVLPLNYKVNVVSLQIMLLPCIDNLKYQLKEAGAFSVSTLKPAPIPSLRRMCSMYDGSGWLIPTLLFFIVSTSDASEVVARTDNDKKSEKPSFLQ